MFAPSDFHKLIWICSIIGAIGGAVGLFWGAVKWMNAMYRKATETIHHIDSLPSISTEVAVLPIISKKLDKIADINIKTDETAHLVAETKAAVDVIQTNHLVHLNQGIQDVAEASEEHTKILASIDKNIALLVDRTPRV